jgi:cyclopropane fatty-acyl-phospholipid synthase-like methyltransferase
MKYSETILKKAKASQSTEGKLPMESLKIINTHYDRLTNQFNREDTRSVHWETKRNQFLRWSILCDIANLSNSNILDFGCGYGDLYDYLNEEFQHVEYIGLDINKQSISIAQQKHPKLNFINTQIQETQLSVDWILASGAFGFALNGYKELYIQTIENLFWRSKKGISFNLLHSEEKRFDEYAVFSMTEILSIAQNLTPKFNLRSDYLPNDVTLHLYH